MERIIRDAKIEIIGENDIKNEAQEKAFIATIKAFGNSSKGFIYAEPCTARSTRRPPDVLLCHPEIGLLIIEVKGHGVNQIEDIKAGNIYVKTHGIIKNINPYRQAEDAMFDIADAVRRKIRSRREEPLFNYMVAFPRIASEDLQKRDFQECLPDDELLLKDEIEDVNKFKQKILSLVESNLAKTREKKPLTISQLKTIKNVFGDAASLKEEKDFRKDIPEQSLGKYIDELACMDKNLSNEQQELSRLSIKGYPRLIRGVAGSGKTIVLANMVARYINREINSENLFKKSVKPPKVAAICFNRALIPFLSEKIHTAYQQQTFQDCPDGILTIAHLNTFLYNLTNGTPLRYVRKDEGDSAFRANRYMENLNSLKQTNPEIYDSLLFDAIFVDEGQDLEPEEYTLLKMLLKNDINTEEKNLIIFYDDAQNLYAKKRPIWKDIGIDLGKGDRSRIMKECFRNTKEILNLGFNVLIGKQAPNSESIKNRTYADIQTLKQNDLITENEELVKVKFTDRSFMRPSINVYNSNDEEKKALSDQIIDLIYNHAVRPEDILILFKSEHGFEDLDKIIKEKDVQGKIEGFIKPFGKYPHKDTYIFQKNCITISTINGAKGYDAYIVFYIGAEANNIDERGRAAFYVAVTRSKLALCISGIKTPDYNLLNEANTLNSKLHPAN